MLNDLNILIATIFCLNKLKSINRVIGKYNTPFTYTLEVSTELNLMYLITILNCVLVIVNSYVRLVYDFGT